jgi:hypothetical protein
MFFILKSIIVMTKRHLCEICEIQLDLLLKIVHQSGQSKKKKNK